MKSNTIEKVLTWAFDTITIITVVALVIGVLIHQLSVWDIFYLIIVVLNDIGLTINSAQNARDTV